MIICFFDIEEDERSLFATSFSDHTLRFSKESLTKRTVSDAKEADILYVRSFSLVNEDILRLLPKLKFIATRSTGYDNIDVNYCRRRGVIVSNVPAYATNSVAEHTFGLTLALAHNIVHSVSQTRRGDFTEGWRGYEITGKTFGVVGLGRIGSRVAAIARSFDMNVLAVTKHPSVLRERKHGVHFVDLEPLLEKSDIVSLHVPLTNETYHILNHRNISLMKKKSILINTSRGAVVETEAVVWALQHNILAGVGLDVLEEEMHLKKQPARFSSIESLRKDERVLITPHNAYNSKEALKTILHISVENILAFLHNKPMNRVV